MHPQGTMKHLPTSDEACLDGYTTPQRTQQTPWNAFGWSPDGICLGWEGLHAWVVQFQSRHRRELRRLALS